jgi:hypothetical protein
MFQRFKRLLGLLLAGVAVSGCPEIQVAPAICACTTPPADECLGDTLLAYASQGTCDANGLCTYDKAETKCPGGCENAACVKTDLCLGVTCLNPPPDTCDGDKAVTYPTTGTCQSATGQCGYAPAQEDCAAGGKICDAGACGEPPVDPCEGKLCTPLAATCAGDTAITYEAKCVAGECKNEAANLDCAARGQICAGGACIPPEQDPCKDVLCKDPPQAYCGDPDETVSITYGTVGTCNKLTGKCEYPELAEDCAAAGQLCKGGLCMADPCAGKVCEDGEPECSGKFAISHPGACKDGTCTADDLAVDCSKTGKQCCGGACQPDDGCCGITCETPPAPACVAGTAVSYGQAGTCQAAKCSYPQETSEDCAASGQFCAAGACVEVSPCEAITCEVVPEPGCQQNRVVTYSGPGACQDGECGFATTLEDCSELGQGYGCEAGACVDKCTNVDCEIPPANACVGTVLTSYGSGKCVAGTCEYGESQTDCATLGQACKGGACVDACAGVSCLTPPPATCKGTKVATYDSVGTCELGTCGYAEELTACNTPPDPGCEGSLALTWGPDGSCKDGACEYLPKTTECSALGKLCSGGQCLDNDPCVGIVCESPPPAVCEGTNQVTYAAPGTCLPDAAGKASCKYQETHTDCTASFETCEAGACVDKCQGVACNTPPADGCASASTVTDYDLVGACDWKTGTCSYGSKTVTCGEDQACNKGACTYKCVADGCNLPASSVCQGDTLMVYGAGGTCDPGSGCKAVLAGQQVCNDAQLRCENDACVDKCAGVTCANPPVASCQGDVAITWAAKGSCAWQTGTCAYTQDSTNCAASGQVCVGGGCVHACVTQGCKVPAKSVCEGGKLVTYAAGGSCDPDAGCSQATTTTDCSASKQVCETGQCVNKCAGVGCTAPPPAGCDATDKAVAYTAVGATCNWQDGKCSYPSTTTDCPAQGLVCLEGACALCPVGEIMACNGQCSPQQLLGNAVCDPQFFCSEHKNDAGNCKTCTNPTFISDCLGGCSDALLLSNGACDKAFNCKAYGYDAGLCQSGPCAAKMVPDCDGNCQSASLVSSQDSTCDEGQGQGEGQFRCAAYNWDAGACCPPGQAKDCQGQCRGTATMTDAVCDVAWLCSAGNYDGGACRVGCPAGQIKDCKGGCAAQTGPGNATCDPALLCPTYAYDQAECRGNCQDATFAQACDGSCVPAVQWDDGACTLPFLCSAYTYDGADCQGACQPGQLAGCHGECTAQTKLDDGICNVELLCAKYGFDGADCQGECKAGEVKDCWGTCLTAAALDDGKCTGGFNCALFGHDYGDCQGGCPKGQVVSCTGGCLKQASIGDLTCDLELVCAPMGWDGGDCGGGCPFGEVRSCTGACLAGSKLGGTCTPELFCDAFEADRGACTLCPAPGDIIDCNGKCSDSALLSNGACDAGFDCASFAYDSNHCVPGAGEPASPCPVNNVPDCANQCRPANWVSPGDSLCDDKAGGAEGQFRCEAFNWDAGACCPYGQEEGCNEAFACKPLTTHGDGVCNYEWLCLADYVYDGGDCRGTCATGQVQSCTGACVPETQTDDGVCQAQLFCEAYNNDAGRCAACPNLGDIIDCNGKCSPASGLGDGMGTPEFDCPIFNRDAGEYALAGCGKGAVYNCKNGCSPAKYLWDESTGCDLEFACAAFSYDTGHCILQ